MANLKHESKGDVWGREKRRGSFYRITPTYSPLSYSLLQPLEEHEGSV
jgi:hypothetical protein